MPPTTSQVRSVTASRNHLSWVITRTASALRLFKWLASHATPSTSKWLVGSSNKIKSSSSINNVARPTLRLSPPDKVESFLSNRWSSNPPNRPVKTSLIPESLAHSCFARSPITTSPTFEFGSALSTCESSPIFTEFALVTLPSSGLSMAAITFISVLLPEPLRPTIPIRSPSETPSETLSSSALISKALLTSSIFTRLRATMGERTFQL